MADPIQTALERLETLGRISDDPSRLVRTFLSPANRVAAETVASWMEAAGMETSHAADGTIRGILPGTDPSAKPLLLGSHLDTVIDAGKYDGALGIIAALAAIESLPGPPARPIHLLGFSDEEGVRFHTTYLGSRSVTGPLDAETLATPDASGRSIAEAIEEEGWHEGATAIHYEAHSTYGYVELHIEQGRVLEEAGEPACVVSAISGQARVTVALDGLADHAGTTPMPLRRDALTGAAACILKAEAIARSEPPLVITVGSISIHPGASNCIPGSARFTIDLRHPEDERRLHHLSALEEKFAAIAAERGLGFRWKLVQDDPSAPCDPALTAALLDALESVTGNRRSMPSGAGHDAVALSKLGPIAMLFVRCREGLSHHPDEFASPEDIATGIRILNRFLARI